MTQRMSVPLTYFKVYSLIKSNRQRAAYLFSIIFAAFNVAYIYCTWVCRHQPALRGICHCHDKAVLYTGSHYETLWDRFLLAQCPRKSWASHKHIAWFFLSAL